MEQYQTRLLGLLYLFAAFAALLSFARRRPARRPTALQTLYWPEHRAFTEIPLFSRN